MKKKRLIFLSIFFLLISFYFFKNFIDLTARFYHLNGTVLVAKGDKIIFQNSYGFENKEKNIKNNLKTIYPVASITKSFTAISILQLEEEGKLSTNDPLSRYIPGFPEGDKITLHNLLTHSSGIKEMLDVVDNHKQASPEEVISVLKNQSLNFEPGSQFQYSDSNYLILGYIVEKVSGVPLHDYVKKNIFDKAGMSHSYFLTENPKHMALGYVNMEAPGYFYDNSLNFGLGDIVSTPNDLVKYSLSIENHVLLNKKETNKMQTGYIPTDSSNHTKYGYGWFITKENNQTLIEHPGNLPGYNSQILRIPEKNVTIVVLENNESNFNIISFSHHIFDLL